MTSQKQENAAPQVQIVSPSAGDVLTWDSQIRYQISVTDREDGESRYGEINPDEVLLEVEYLSGPDDSTTKEKITKSRAGDEPAGLFLIRTSTCFGCHRDDTRLVGPSFSELARRYEPDTSIISDLGTRIIEGSSGNWGTAEMPPNDSLSHQEAMEIASYILDQGGNKQRSIYPGLEGVIRIIEKPPVESRGVVLLKASYLDHGAEGESGSRKRGVHTMVLDIR